MKEAASTILYYFKRNCGIYAFSASIHAEPPSAWKKKKKKALSHGQNQIKTVEGVDPMDQCGLALQV